jgi:nucleotide-binding universal stress UspA family protein
MTRILLAVDETEASEKAARFTEQLFAGRDVEMIAVNVARAPIGWTSAPAAWVPPVPFGGYYPWPVVAPAVGPLTSPAAERSVRAEEDAARSVAARQAPPGAEVEAMTGDPADAISRAAEAKDVDLIVVGSGDKGLIQRWFGRSVSEDLTRELPRPVLVVG